MVPAAVVDKTIAELLPLLESGRHPDRRRQLLLRRRHPPRQGARRRGHPLRGRRDQRRRLGAGARLLPDDRRRGGGRCERLDPIFATPGPRHRRHRRARRDGRRSAAPPSRAICTAGRTAPGTSSRWCTTASSTASWPPTPRAWTSYARPTSASRARRQSTPRRRRCAIPSTTSTTSTCGDIAEVWRRGSVIASWLLDLTATALLEDPDLTALRRPGLGLGRGPLDDQGRDRRGRAGAGADHGALRAVQLARRGRLPGQAAVGDALRVRRTSGEDPVLGKRRFIGVSGAGQDGPPFSAATCQIGPLKMKEPGNRAFSDQGRFRPIFRQDAQ